MFPFATSQTFQLYFHPSNYSSKIYFVVLYSEIIPYTVIRHSRACDKGTSPRMMLLFKKIQAFQQSCVGRLNIDIYTYHSHGAILEAISHYKDDSSLLSYVVEEVP